MTCLALPAWWEEHPTLPWYPHSSHPVQWCSAQSQDVARPLQCHHWNPSNTKMRWQSPSLFLKTGKHREAPGWDTCLHLDGAAADGAHGFAHEVDVHLGGIFLELCQDLWGHHTNVSPWGHSENSPPSQLMLLGHQKTSRIFFHTSSQTLPSASPSEARWFGYTGVGHTWCRLDKVKRWPGLDYFQFPWTKAGEKSALPSIKVSTPSYIEDICCNAKLSATTIFDLSFSVLRWTFGSLVNPNRRCRGYLRTLWNIHTQINNSSKILPLVKQRFIILSQCFC